jgi:hypothetical protein
MGGNGSGGFDFQWWRSDHPTQTRGQGGAGGTRALLEKEKGGGQKRATVMAWQPFYRGVAGRRGRGGSQPKRSHAIGGGRGSLARRSGGDERPTTAQGRWAWVGSVP